MNEEERILALERRVQELENRLSSSSSSTKTEELVKANGKVIQIELGKLAERIKLVDEPQFFVGSSPLFATAISSLFESASSPVNKLFEHPGQVRENGFVLYAADFQSTIVEGTAREIILRSQARRITRSGEFTALFEGGDDFLCWAMRGEGWPMTPSQLAGPWTINPLVLVESTHNCVTLAKQLLAYAEAEPTLVQFVIGFSNLSRDGKAPYLLDGKADRQRLGRPKVQGPRGDCFFSIIAPKEQSAERVAFRLVAEIYHMFNLVDDVIPYTAIVDGERAIDITQF
jgi:hypothetical protein